MPVVVVILGRADPATVLRLPAFLCRVPAGFPSPADDYQDSRLDLNERLITHPAATFFAHAEGHSMTGAGIHDGDLLIVNRALEPRPGCIVVACIDGELTVKRFCVRDGRPCLAPDNPDFPVLVIEEGQELIIWGVVTHNVHALGPRDSSPPSRGQPRHASRSSRNGEARR